MEGQFKYLFTPFKIGPIIVRNRIASTAHLSQLADQDHILDERYIEYQRTKVRGGVGLTICGMMVVMPNARDFSFVQQIYNERAVPRLRQLGDAVHQEGGKVFVQLCHSGRETDIEITREPSWAPSPVPPSVLFHDVPKEMEIEDIQEVIKAFGRSAGFAKEAGLDGVEIHGASGYLVQQFLSPFTNKRTDEYGGTTGKRMRFLLEVIDSIRETVRNEFVVGIRLVADELVPGGYNLEGGKEIAQELEATGKIDYISISSSFYEALFSQGQGMQVPVGGIYSGQCAQIKEVVDLPIMNTLRVNDPVQAEKLLADGIVDMVGMCRALIADPELPNKALQGRLEEIRSCIACNQGCMARMLKAKPITCLQNAAIGREKEIGTLEPAKTRKKVMIIGGGPAGLETARVARSRGHEVALYEKDEELGGQVNLAVKVPIRQELGGCTRYLIKQMEILGVKVNLGVEATPELVAREKPDVVVVATGSAPFRAPLPGADQGNVLTVWDVLQEKVEIGENVVLVDGGEAHWQCVSTAEYMAEKGRKVEIITPQLFVGAEAVTTGDLLAALIRMRAKGVVFSPSTALREIAGKTVVVLDLLTNMEKRIEGVGTVVLAMGSRANNQLYRSLKGKVKELHAVGDCVTPRKALDAIHDGYILGRTL